MPSSSESICCGNLQLEKEANTRGKEKRFISASSPGKILLIGGYSILEKGNIGYVVAIDKRVRSRIETIDSKEVLFELPQFIGAGSEKFKFMKACADLAKEYFGQFGNAKISSVNDEGFTFGGGRLKSGFGSSAAAVVSISAVICRHFGISDVEFIHKFSQLAHSRAQGKVGSGFDVACSTYGSIVYSRYSPKLLEENARSALEKKWDFEIRKMSLPSNLKLVVGFTRKSASTVNLLKNVNEWKKNHAQEYSVLMKKMDIENEKAIESLAKMESEMSEKGMKRFRKAFNEGRKLAKILGEKCNSPIESDEHTRLLKIAEENGAVCAKSPGAGGGDSLVAISEQDCAGRIEKAWEEKGLVIIDVKPSGEGLLWE